MEKNETVITECFECGTRYENHFNASPCCKSIIVKVDEHGNRTSITFLSTFSIPSHSEEEQEEEILEKA
ncbi:hypothetical protein [Chryseobacterium salviniae]|uniref:Uncharacterized protein n=1 Tax=Chryseobacterium salviniae TaxID=3101750 RepID=A0ABU6HS66_9FLAO|nr:hypothetical protein [Chryseobacterium sp. T9W2-O]MEC3875880.1 hypothetical protein [Chryseobacterium sp. T9W2-O]